jgi:hypothetical protein
MFVVTLRVLGKVLVVSHESSNSPLPCRASFPSEMFPIMRHVPTVHPHSRGTEQSPGQRSVYLTPFHFAKGISSLAARKHARSCQFLTILHQLRIEMMVPAAEPEQADGEVRNFCDALARSRGRSKTCEIPDATLRAAKAIKAVAMIVLCELCDGSHDLSSCPDQDIVLGARIANANAIPWSGQRNPETPTFRAVIQSHDSDWRWKRLFFLESDINSTFSGEINLV